MTRYDQRSIYKIIFIRSEGPKGQGIYSNEHRPIHVQVRYGGGEAVFDVEQAVELRESQGLKVRELAKAEEGRDYFCRSPNRAKRMECVQLAPLSTVAERLNGP